MIKKVRGVDVRDDPAGSHEIAHQVEEMAQEILIGLTRRFTKPSEQKLLFCALCTAVGGMLGLVEDQNSELTPEDIAEILSPYALLGISRTLTNKDQRDRFFNAAQKAMEDLAKKTENIEMTAGEFHAEDAFHGLDLGAKPH